MVIELESLTKRYGSIAAVDRIDLEVDAGEAFGFLGPNGAGKSTTINLLLDLVRPTDGRALVFGRDVHENPVPIRRRIGVLPEGISLAGELTAVEHLRTAMRIKDVSSDPAALLERVGLAYAADQHVGSYSTGMRQRLGLALALVGDPDLLVLDEPSTGLDPRGVRRMREIIRSEAADGTTVFFSSHILPQVEAVCDRVGIINDGRFVEVGPVSDVRRRLGSETRVTFQLESPVDVRSAVEPIDGVEGVTVDGTKVAVNVAAPPAKVAAIERVFDVANVADLQIADPSLESVFDAVVTEDSRSNPSSGGRVQNPPASASDRA